MSRIKKYNPNLKKEQPELWEFYVDTLEILREVRESVNNSDLQRLKEIDHRTRAIISHLKLLIGD